MREIQKLFEQLDYRILQGSLEGEITELVFDSRKATEGCLFVCIRGANVDGHSFASAVADSGARVIVCEEPVDVRRDVTVIGVENTREALAVLSAAYFDHPAEEVRCIGITGTKGKTTTTYMVRSILENAGFSVGLIGTIETIIGEEHKKALNTTPESYAIQEDLRRMADVGQKVCVMEVSSQGLMMHRVDGMTFDIGIFTNIEPDHIGPNEHKDFDDYLHAKSLLFRKCRRGLLNADDPHLERILEGHTCEVATFGFSEEADFCAENMELVSENGSLGVAYDTTGVLPGHFAVPLPGRFSVYNSLTAIAICHYFGVEAATMQKALSKVSVKGRIEPVPISEHFTVLIDYAHNAMSLKSLLSTLRDYKPSRLVCIFGCGGNRSRLRRFEMGEVSGELADFTVITSD
ncbi:MAG: UDP-N-acetylmuramoyl-L-alanyl-D-glutamate--2,6-diaminopimelate ligase, partial [Lachnospiraceae bacterium]|nr:UDP-N-acetylmuramoyl-L-alanyl-D-glutamate--2,6-diaminopimelate ligase [Lachnospiraceae bacterium]